MHINATTHQLFPSGNICVKLDEPQYWSSMKRVKNQAAVNKSSPPVRANHWQIWLLVLSSLVSPTGPIRVILDAGMQLKWDASNPWICQNRISGTLQEMCTPSSQHVNLSNIEASEILFSKTSEKPVHAVKLSQPASNSSQLVWRHL